jgi:hypothetical protein
MKRWLLLENNTALSDPGWLPPPEAWPELAELRAEHERLLTVARQEAGKLSKLRKQQEDAEAARGEAMKAAFLAGNDPDAEKNRKAQTRLELDIAEARLRVEAATDALVAFLTEAIAEVERRAPEFYATLDSRRAEAEVKRKAAQRLLEEADAVVGEADRMRGWLDRESGKSALGHYPYEQMPVPDPAYTSDSEAAAVVAVA